MYKDRKNLLSLYNAMNGTAYENEEELEVVTLEEWMSVFLRVFLQSFQREQRGDCRDGDL